MQKKLHIDIETRSKVDLKNCGVYKYASDPSFKTLIASFYLEDNNSPDTISEKDIYTVDLLSGESIPKDLKNDILDGRLIKVAYNAQFERVCFSWMFKEWIDAVGWECTMTLAAYNGLPLNLKTLTKIFNLEYGKLEIGDVMGFFSNPSKRKNVEFNSIEDSPNKWEAYKIYNKRDVCAEYNMLKYFAVKELPETEKLLYVIDARINDKGVGVDMQLVENAIEADKMFEDECFKEGTVITGLANFNSDDQMKAWVGNILGTVVPKLDKEAVKAMLNNEYIQNFPQLVKALEVRKQLKKTSNRKYNAILNRAVDNIVRGALLFYGANRSGRWAGRGVQLHNLPRNYTKHLNNLRECVKKGVYGIFKLIDENPRYLLSQLIRTAFVPSKPSHKFIPCDFSAIEARVAAWLAGCKWRMDVFKNGGDIYKSSIAMMYNKKVEDVTDIERQDGKIRELAFTYAGTYNSFLQQGAEFIKKLGLTESQIMQKVKEWRAASPEIPKLWYASKDAATNAIMSHSKGSPGLYTVNQYVSYYCVEILGHKYMACRLPSGRELYYFNPKLVKDKYGLGIQYAGLNDKGQWVNDIRTHGGKLVENYTQAIARDCLAVSMIDATCEGFDIRLHVHDELVPEVPAEIAEGELKRLSEIMSRPIPWAPGLILKAEGFITDYYRK